MPASPTRPMCGSSSPRCAASSARLITGLRGVRPRSPFARAIAEIVDAWAAGGGVTYAPSPARAADAAATPAARPRWVAFLLAFDVDYRQAAPALHHRGAEPALPDDRPARFDGLDPAAVDGLKRWFYDRLEALDSARGGGSTTPSRATWSRASSARRRRAAEMKDIAPLCTLVRRNAQGPARPPGRAHRRPDRSRGEHARHRRLSGRDRRLAAARAA